MSDPADPRLANPTVSTLCGASRHDECSIEVTTLTYRFGTDGLPPPPGPRFEDGDYRCTCPCHGAPK